MEERRQCRHIHDVVHGLVLNASLCNCSLEGREYALLSDGQLNHWLQRASAFHAMQGLSGCS